MIAQPPAGAAVYIASVVELERLTGEFPIYVMQEPIGVRGQRLCASPVDRKRLGADEMSMIIVIQADDSVRRLEQVILFDPEDSADALAARDRLSRRTRRELNVGASATPVADACRVSGPTCRVPSVPTCAEEDTYLAGAS